MTGRRTLIRKIGEWFQSARLCLRVTSLFSQNYFPTLIQTIRLCEREGFLPDEAYQFGLFQPELSPEILGQYFSKKSMTRLQSLLNPKSWIYATEDKGIFYRFAEAWGIPIPRLYALYYRKSPGWALPNIVLSDKKAWTRYLEDHVPEDFVMKPCRGVYGRNVRIFIKSNEGFQSPFGEKYSAGEIYDLMAKDPVYDRYVIQERLVNHPDIVQLTGTPYLQTVRISTLMDENDKCHILHSSFRMVMGDQVIDNFSTGSSGNLLSGVVMDKGVLKQGITRDEKGMIAREVWIHPRTGVRIEGFRLPSWEACLRLVKESAPKFLPIRTLGWDVGLTPQGPVIVEANMFWDPPNQSRCGRVLLHKLKETWNLPWDALG